MIAFRRRAAPEPPPEQRIGPLDAAGRQWITQLLQPLSLQVDALSDLFESSRRDWFAADPAARSDPNPLINAVGAGIGQLLVDRVGLRWAVVTDADGSEPAVVGRPGEIIVYPMNLVAKRWVPDEESDLFALYRGVVIEIQRIQDRLEAAR